MATNLYVNIDWAGSEIGDLIIDQGKVLYFGTNAFADIQSAVDKAHTDSNNDPSTIHVYDGTYADNVYFRMEAGPSEYVVNGVTNVNPYYYGDDAKAEGNSTGDITIVADGENVKVTGSFIIGTYLKRYKSYEWNTNLTIEGINFATEANEADDNTTPSLSTQALKSGKQFIAKDCTFTTKDHNGFHVSSPSGSYGTWTFKDCEFTDGRIESIGTMAFTTSDPDDPTLGCKMNDTTLNFQRGTSVSVDHSTLSRTLTDDYSVGSFYLIRSNDIPVTISDCVINIDSTASSSTKPESDGDWSILWQRGAGDKTWNVNDVTVNYTTAATEVADLVFDYNDPIANHTDGTPVTLENQVKRVTFDNLTYTVDDEEADVDSLLETDIGYASTLDENGEKTLYHDNEGSVADTDTVYANASWTATSELPEGAVWSFNAFNNFTSAYNAVANDGELVISGETPVDGSTLESIDKAFTISGAGAITLGIVTVATAGEIAISDVKLTATSLTNSGTITASGTATFDIETLSGNGIDFADGAIIKDSTVGGSVNSYINGKVTFKGDNSFGGFSLVNYGSEIIVDEGNTLTVTTNRLTLGYSLNFTVTGSIADALTADKTQELLSLDYKPGFSITGGGTSYFTVKDAYVKLGDTSVKQGAATGTFNLTFTNSIVDFTNTYALYERTSAPKGKVFTTFDGSVVTVSSHLKNAEIGDVMELKNGTILNGNNSFRNKGTFKVLSGSKATMNNSTSSGNHGGQYGTVLVSGEGSTLSFTNLSAADPWRNFEGATISVLAGGALNAAYITNDEGATITVDATSSLIASGSLNNSGDLLIFADDTAGITVGSFTNSGTITIDVTKITGDTADVIDVTSATGTAIDKNAIELTGEGASNFGILAKANGGVSVAKVGPNVYVNSAWDEEAEGESVELTPLTGTATKGINAFEKFDDAIATAGKTIYLYDTTNASTELITGKLEDSVLEAAGEAAVSITFDKAEFGINTNTLNGGLTIGEDVTFGANFFVHAAAKKDAEITVNGTFDVLATTATMFEGTMTVNGKVVSTGEGALVIRDGYSLVVNKDAEVNVNTRILDATATFTNASMAADLTIANNKGKVNVSTATITGKVTNAGLITVNNLGMFSATSIENSGTINLVITEADIDKIDVTKETYKLINITGAGAALSTSGITVNNEAWDKATKSFTKTVGGVDYTYRLMQFENDICLSSIDVDPAQVYVNSAWATGYEYGQMIEKGKYYLINAFSTMLEATTSVNSNAGGTITIEAVTVAGEAGGDYGNVYTAFDAAGTYKVVGGNITDKAPMSLFLNGEGVTLNIGDATAPVTVYTAGKIRGGKDSSGYKHNTLNINNAIIGAKSFAGAGGGWETFYDTSISVSNSIWGAWLAGAQDVEPGDEKYKGYYDNATTMPRSASAVKAAVAAKTLTYLPYGEGYQGQNFGVVRDATFTNTTFAPAFFDVRDRGEVTLDNSLVYVGGSLAAGYKYMGESTGNWAWGNENSPDGYRVGKKATITLKNGSIIRNIGYGNANEGFGLQIGGDASTATHNNDGIINVTEGSELLMDAYKANKANEDANIYANGELNINGKSKVSARNLTNAGTITLGNEAVGTEGEEGYKAASTGTLTAATLTNSGAINAYSGSTIESTGALTNSGSISLAGESTMTTGAITNSTNGSISADNSTIAATSIFTFGSFTATNNSEIKSTSTHITNLTTFNVTDSTVSASGSFLNGRDSNKPAAKATFTNATLIGSVTNYENATLSLTDSSITRTWGTITNNGTFKDLGGSTITIKNIENTGTFSIAGTAESKASTLTVLGTLTGTIDLLDGAKISASSIAASADESGLSVVADATVAFSGENTFTATTIANAGNITINAMTDLLTAAAIAEGEASSITIDATDFTLAYKKIIDLSQEGALTKVNVSKPDDVKLILAADGDVILAKDTGAKNLYVSDTFADAKYGDEVELVVSGKTLSLVYGINAFSNSADMRAAITEETTDVFFTANTKTVPESYGDLGIEKDGVTIHSIPMGDKTQVILGKFDINDGGDPKHTVTVADGSQFRSVVTGTNALSRKAELVVDGTLIFDWTSQANYPKSEIVVNKTGSLIFENNSVNIINDYTDRDPEAVPPKYNKLTVYGTMQIGTQGEYAGFYPKVAGSEAHGGTTIIDGKEGEGYGILTVNAPAFTVACGYTSVPLDDQGHFGILTIQNGGKLISNAVKFYNGSKGTITVTGTGSEFTNTPSTETVSEYSVGNAGKIFVEDGASFSLGNMAGFVNAETGKIKVSDEGSEFKISAITNNGTIEVKNGSTLNVTADIEGALNNQAALTANASTVEVKRSVNTGTMTIENGAKFYASILLENTTGGEITFNGATLAKKADSTDATSFSNWAGIAQFNNGSTVNANITVHNGQVSVEASTVNGNVNVKAGSFTVGGVSTLNVGALSGTITLAGGADVTATITTGDAGVFSVAAETAAALSGNIGTASVTNAGTLIVSNALTASTISGNGTIKITAAGAAAAEEPIAVKANVSNGIINLVVSDETLAGETGYQFVAGTIGEGVTFQVNGTAYAENVVIKNSKGEDTNYVLNSKGGTGLWMVQKASTTDLSVSSAYNPATDGWNISKFASLVLALKGVQSDTVSLVVEDGYAPATPETLTDDLIVTFAADAAISGKAFTLAGDEDANKENLILRAADGKTLTIGNNITLNNANIVLNYGKQSTAIVSGNLKGYEVQIDGNATVTGTLTADTLLWLRNGKSVATPGAEDNAIALSKAVSAETVLISSGKVTTTADADVTGTSLIIGSVDDTTAAVSIVSTGADWAFSSNMLATGTNADSFTLNGGSLTFNGGESSIHIGTRVVADDTALIENANFTLTLNNGAKLNAKTIDNIGKIIMVDGSATEINATAIVNRASAEVPIPAQKAIINAKNITAGSIENYGTIGNLEVANQKIAKLDVGTLTNKQYGGVFATLLEADSIENSGEIVVKTLTITSDAGLIDNKVGGKIAQDNEAMTIVAKAINNDGYISTHGGAITATAITNGAYDDKTNDGVIAAGNVTASGTISNNGMFVANGNVSAARIEGNGTFTIDGTTTVSGNIVIGNEATFNGNIQTANINAVNASSKINLNGVKLVSTGVVRAIGTITATGATLDGNTLDYQKGRFIIKGASSLKNVTLTSTIELPEGVVPAVELEGVTLDSSASITGGIATVTADSTFNGVNSFGSLAVAEDAELTIVDTNVEEGAIVGPCLTVNGDFSIAGTITLDVTAFDSILAEGKTAQVVSVLGNITNTGDFDVTDGYQVIVQNDGIYVLRSSEPVEVDTICVNQAWKDHMQPGETFEFAGVDCVYGLNAFQNTNEILNLTDYTDTLIFAGGTAAAYKSLVLNTGAEIELQVVKSTGSGVTDIAFEGLSIGNGTEVNVTATDAALGDLTVADGAVLTFDKDVIQTVTATSATITDSTVDFEGNVTITDGATITDSLVDFEGTVTIGTEGSTATVLTITDSRVNTDEDTKTSTTTVNGNVVITNSDMDFDGVATITGNVTIGGDLGSEVEFDRNTTISGVLTLDEGSVVEADQGFSFTAGSSVINGVFYATNKDDENPSDNTDVNLGTVSGTGTIYTDVKSDLTFNTDSSFQGTLSIDVTGLTIGDNKNIKARNVSPYTFGSVVVTGDGVAEDTVYKKYFVYSRNDGFTQRDGACNVYLAKGDAGIDAATSHTWTVDGIVYRPDVIIVSGSIFEKPTYFTGENGDSDVRVESGTFQKIAFGGEKVSLTDDPDEIIWTRSTGLNLTIEKGNFTKNLLGGDNIKQGGVYRRKGDSNLTIKNGTFGNDVAAGLVFNPTSDHMDDDAMITVENTNLTISGGEFNGFVYGGNYAINKSVSGNLTVKGDSTVTLIAGENDITFKKSLYVGSYGYGKVKGNTELVITGEGTITVADKIWGGCSGDFVSERINNAYISPSMGDYNQKRNLTFTGFDGDIDCNNIRAFSNVNVLNKEIEIDDESAIVTTYATLSDKVDLSDVSNWTFDFGSTLSGSFKNDFSKNAQPTENGGKLVYSGDTLVLNLANANWEEEEYAEGWTLFDYISDSAADTIGGFSSVTAIGLEEALSFEWNKEDAWIATYGEDSYSLSIAKITKDDATRNAMVLTHSVESV